jgi:hypothetical protein
MRRSNSAVVESLIAIGLWLLMAWGNKNGRAGRIVATVCSA